MKDKDKDANLVRVGGNLVRVGVRGHGGRDKSSLDTQFILVDSYHLPDGGRGQL